MNKLSTKLVVAIGIGAALYGILGLWGFSIAPNTFIKPALAILTVFWSIIWSSGRTVNRTYRSYRNRYDCWMGVFGGDGLLVQELLVFQWGLFKKKSWF